MRKPALATVAALGVSALFAFTGCSDLTHPDEIRIIAEPAAPAAPQGGPKPVEAQKPAGAMDANRGGPRGDAAQPQPQRPRPQPAADPGACGG